MLKKPIKEYAVKYPIETQLSYYYGDCETCNICNTCENSGTNTCLWSNK